MRHKGPGWQLFFLNITLIPEVEQSLMYERGKFQHNNKKSQVSPPIFKHFQKDMKNVQIDNIW